MPTEPTYDYRDTDPCGDDGLNPQPKHPMLHTTHIAGIPHRKPDLSSLRVGQELKLVPEPDNKFDPNAIKVCVPSPTGTFTAPVHLGYIPKTETNFFKDYSGVYIHSIQPTVKWQEVTIGNEAPV